MARDVSSFLNNCPHPIRKTFLEFCFQRGEIILSQGNMPEYIYILLEGEAKVYHMADNGIYLLEYIYNNGEFFGEIEVLNGKPILADVIASAPCKAIRITKDAFLKWIKHDVDFLLFICQNVADKLYNASLASATNIAYPLKYRVLYFLWNAYRQDNKYVNKEDIVTGLGSNERSINRIIKELSDNSLIDYDRGIIKLTSILDVMNGIRMYT